VESRVYTDDTTGVQNKAAYRNKIKELDEQIKAGNAVFSIAFFDINGIKKIYVHYGFEAGEKLMFECAELLKNVFGRENVYHITGDEFIVIMERKQRLAMKEYFEKFEAALKQYNDEHVQENNLSVAKGTVTFDPEKHQDYRQVFVEVKEACDKDKDEYYGRNTVTI
jgi:diguanylate cyclase (GGDEF)-like protein